MTCYRPPGATKDKQQEGCLWWGAWAAALDVTLLHSVSETAVETRRRIFRNGGQPGDLRPGSSCSVCTASNPCWLAELIPRFSMWGSGNPCDIDPRNSIVASGLGTLGGGGRVGVPSRELEMCLGFSCEGQHGRSAVPCPRGAVCVFARYYCAADAEDCADSPRASHSLRASSIKPSPFVTL